MKRVIDKMMELMLFGSIVGMGAIVVYETGKAMLIAYKEGLLAR